jgi:acyl carrier protein
MNKIELEKKIFTVLLEFIKDNDISIEGELNNETRLIGSAGIFDSIDLVSFIVELEEVINDAFSTDIELANDSVMSSRTSPFINISTLSDYILKIYN